MPESSVSIAVMPFRNLSQESGTEYFANGFVEDLTADLTRFPTLKVLAMQSTFALQQSDQPIDAVARDWDLDFVLEGSVRRGKENLRVSVQLIRLRSRGTVWAERFDAPLEDVFQIQDEIAATVAGQLAVQVDAVELENAQKSAAESLPAYEAWLRGMDCLNRGTLEGDEESRGYFEQSLQIDARYARALAGLSLSHFNEWTCHAWHLWDENESNAFDYATKAAELDDRDPIVQSVLARVCRFRHHHLRADQHIARALSLNPNDARVLIQAAIVKLFGGEADEACGLASRAIELNPLHGNWYYGIVGWCQFMMRQYESALDGLSRAAEIITNYPAYRAACLVMLGDQPEARREYELFEREYRERIAFGREPAPGEALTWAVQVEPFRNIEDSKRMPEALSRAGIATIDVDRAIQLREKQMVRPAGITVPEGNRFHGKEGIWSITYDGEGARLAELKGFHDIARLLAQPNQQLHCLELSGASPDTAVPDEVLDSQSRQEYRRRIKELQGELEQAEADNDPARSEPARNELDALIDELANATGLGGRSRKLGNVAEKARTAVTWRIRSSIKKIRAAHPRLGQHLSNSIRTGNFCVYSPESAVDWLL